MPEWGRSNRSIPSGLDACYLSPWSRLLDRSARAARRDSGDPPVFVFAQERAVEIRLKTVGSLAAAGDLVEQLIYAVRRRAVHEQTAWHRLPASKDLPLTQLANRLRKALEGAAR